MTLTMTTIARGLVRELASANAGDCATEHQATQLDALVGVPAPEPGRHRYWERLAAAWKRVECAERHHPLRTQTIHVGDAWVRGEAASLPQIAELVRLAIRDAIEAGDLPQRDVDVSILRAWCGVGIVLDFRGDPYSDPSFSDDDFLDLAYAVIEPHRYAVWHYGAWDEGEYLDIDTAPLIE